MARKPKTQLLPAERPPPSPVDPGLIHLPPELRSNYVQLRELLDRGREQVLLMYHEVGKLVVKCLNEAQDELGRPMEHTTIFAALAKALGVNSRTLYHYNGPRKLDHGARDDDRWFVNGRRGCRGSGSSTVRV